MSYGDKVAQHPDREEIVDRLLAGESVRSVSAWLKAKYPNDKKRVISYLTLQRYRKDHLNLKGEVLSDIQSEMKSVTTVATAERVTAQRDLSIKESDQYQEAKLAIANDILSREQLILDLHDKIWQRVKMLEDQEFNYKNETVIVQYMTEMRQLMEGFHKMVVDIHKLNEKKGNQTQVNVQLIQEQAESQVNAVKSAVKDILQEMDPELIPTFLDKLKERMSEVEAKTAPQVNVQVNNYG